MVHLYRVSVLMVGIFLQRQSIKNLCRAQVINIQPAHRMHFLYVKIILGLQVLLLALLVQELVVEQVLHVQTLLLIQQELSVLHIAVEQLCIPIQKTKATLPISGVQMLMCIHISVHLFTTMIVCSLVVELL